MRRVAAAATFKLYDGDLEGCVKVSHFHFIFRDLVEKKFISSRVSFDSVVDLLDPQEEGLIRLNKFIAWLDTVRGPTSVFRLLTVVMVVVVRWFRIPITSAAAKNVSADHLSLPCRLYC